MLMLFLAAAVSIDPRIIYQYELTVSIEVNQKVVFHTESYRSSEACEKEHDALTEIAANIPNTTVSDCDYVGLV